jgi:hypothetical protein
MRLDTEFPAQLRDDPLAGSPSGSLASSAESRTERITMAICGAQPQLVQHARDLGNNTDIMNSYKRVQGTEDVERSQTWFFAKNASLAGVSSKPSTLPTSWEDWSGLNWPQRVVLANLGGFDSEHPDHNNANLAKIANAYGSWPDGHVAAFWANVLPDGGSVTHVNTCNIFVGETLWSDGKSLMLGSKYASADQIYQARVQTSPLRWRLERVSVGEAQPGDIAAWPGHVEIVSSLDVDAGTFCSIGGWRNDMGTEKCAENSEHDARLLALATGESPTLLIYRWCEQERPAEEARKRGCGCLRFW